MDRIASDYFCFRIPRDAQTNPVLLLATSGVLNASSHRFKLFIESVKTEQKKQLMFENAQGMKMVAQVISSDDELITRFNTMGSPAQCYTYFVSEFKTFLKKHNDSIYLKPHEEPTLEELMEEITSENEQENTCLYLVQQQVDKWIKSVGVDYFDEMTNLSNLIEETGEVARLIGREYGQQSFKPGERPACVKTAIADELSDVLFIAVCLANQMGIDLDSAFARNMNKKTSRDRDRHKNNPAFKSKQAEENE